MIESLSRKARIKECTNPETGVVNLTKYRLAKRPLGEKLKDPIANIGVLIEAGMLYMVYNVLNKIKRRR